MALFKYFKRTSKRTKGHRETLSANDINKANESIATALEVKGWGNTTPTRQDNAHYNHCIMIMNIFFFSLTMQFFTYQRCPSVLVHVVTSNTAVNFIHAHH